MKDVNHLDIEDVINDGPVNPWSNGINKNFQFYILSYSLLLRYNKLTLNEQAILRRSTPNKWIKNNL